jgi:arylsulfatase A-like enzyme
VAAPGGVKFDGEDLSAVWKGAKQARSTPLFWEYGRKPPTDAPGKIRAFPYPTEPDSKSPNVAIRDGDWKLLVNADGTGAELYDLATDRNETHNLAAEKTDVAKRLTDAVLAWRQSLPSATAK